MSRGQVRLPQGEVRTFRTLVKVHDNKPFLQLPPGRSLGQSLTFAAGRTRRLVPVARHAPVAGRSDLVPGWGSYVSKVKQRLWLQKPADDAHRQAAERMNSSPSALLSLAIGGDHLEEEQRRD